jgi:hypothetical protein
MGFRVFSAVSRMPVVAHLAAAAVTLGGFQWVKARLDASYAASKHPVDYATGQMAFDAQTIEGYYAQMIEAGTLPIYWQTQFIDFGFIATMMAVAIVFGTLAARLGGRINRVGVWGAFLGLSAAKLGVIGASLDVLENLISFAMLARPEAIPQALALPYSAAATAKFIALTVAMACLLLSIFAGIAARVYSAVAKQHM